MFCNSVTKTVQEKMAAEASPTHSAAVHNFHNDDNSNRFIGARITDNTSKTIRDRNNEEHEGVSEMICTLLQYQGVPEVETDKFNSNSLGYQYFMSMFNHVAVKQRSW